MVVPDISPPPRSICTTHTFTHKYHFLHNSTAFFETFYITTKYPHMLHTLHTHLNIVLAQLPSHVCNKHSSLIYHTKLIHFVIIVHMHLCMYTFMYLSFCSRPKSNTYSYEKSFICKSDAVLYSIWYLAFKIHISLINGIIWYQIDTKLIPNWYQYGTKIILIWYNWSCVHPCSNSFMRPLIFDLALAFIDGIILAYESCILWSILYETWPELGSIEIDVGQ